MEKAKSIFRCWVENSPLAPILHVQGDVDLLTAPEFRACMRSTASSTTHNGYVVVDLSELEYIDGGGLRVLEEGAALCQQGSRELVLMAPPPHIERILEMVQLTDHLPVLNSVEALSGRAQLNGDQADRSWFDTSQPVPGRAPHGERAPIREADTPVMSEHGSWAFTIELETDPHVIRAVRKVIAAVARIGGARDVDARCIELSVGEALANARFHAYQNGVGPIEATVKLDGGMFSVLIQNDGKPVTSGTRVPDALEASESLNWGLYLIGRMMDKVEITRSTLGDTGTAIRMSKRLAAQLWVAPSSRGGVDRSTVAA